MDAMIREVVKYLPEEKPRLYQGSCDPLRILELIELGVDMFESSYVYHGSQDGFALSFPNKLEDEVIPENEDTNGANEKLLGYRLDIKDPMFKEDFSPLVKTCSCYACRKHTRAYVNHLLFTKELLGYVLLMIHNLHHYKVFFQTIRDCIDKEGSLESIKSKLLLVREK